ncbi:MAG: hypothetical protein RIC19_19150 [Phaeodactylibacter sp.]|uniref:hypothetical protein n=1 Tax=Phaeodactylibacter sp. TaxID=1940289 RepID=UPI0032EB03AD
MANSILWNRLETRARSEQFEENLGNQLYDPYWILCRQWQTGEFEGTDNGSPAEVRVKWQQYPFRQLSADENAPVNYTNEQPMEAEVGRVAIQPGIPLRIEMGRQLQRMLKQALGNAAAAVLESLRQQPALQFQLPASATPEDRMAHAHQLSNRGLQTWVHAAVQTGAIDGGALYNKLRAGQSLSDFLTGSHPQADEVGEQWIAWFDEQYNQPVDETKDAWRPERMEYRFQAYLKGRNGAPMQLGAQEYYEGRLDWYSFEVAESGRGSRDEVQEPHIRHLIPTEVEYPGMPAARWWEMEDGKVNLLALEASATQSGRLALMEFGLMYSNDWFMLPLRVPAGGLLEVEGLEVRDVFGQWSEAAHYRDAAGSPHWNYFGLTGINDPGSRYDQYLLLPPGVVDLKESQAQEEIYLARDEMANMVWGIEYYISDGIDGRREGNVSALNTATYLQALSEEVTGGTPPAPPLDNDALVRYRLATEVPEHWIPFKATLVPNGGGAIRLQRAAMPRVYPGLPIERIRPRTSLLRYGLDKPGYEPFFVPEEEVPKAGVRVSRTWQRTRWHNGRVALWSGFRKQNGRGQGNSGLRFDGLFEKD